MTTSSCWHQVPSSLQFLFTLQGAPCQYACNRPDSASNSSPHQVVACILEADSHRFLNPLLQVWRQWFDPAESCKRRLCAKWATHRHFQLQSLQVLRHRGAVKDVLWVQYSVIQAFVLSWELDCMRDGFLHVLTAAFTHTLSVLFDQRKAAWCCVSKSL